MHLRNFSHNFSAYICGAHVHCFFSSSSAIQSRKCCSNHSGIPVDKQTSLHSSQEITLTSRASAATPGPTVCPSHGGFKLFTTALIRNMSLCISSKVQWETFCGRPARAYTSHKPTHLNKYFRNPVILYCVY